MEFFDDKRVATEIDFDKIYLLYYPRLLLFAVKLTGNKEESEEILQEVFIRFWEKGSISRIKFSVRAYLFRSVYNACLDYLKKSKVQMENIFDQPAIPGNSAVEFCDPVLLEELRDAIKKSIEGLPVQCKKAFLLHRDEQLTYREIAKKMNVSVKTVETHIYRAVKVLKKSLVEYLYQIF
jgi:RNA polymerase sigma-70 factor (ECF subfamily)